MVFTKFAPLVAVAALAMGQAAAAPRVDPTVHRTLREQATVNLVITMKNGVTDALSSVKESEFGDRGQKIAAIVTSLEANAQASQASLNALLAREAGSATPLFTSQQTFWITNQKVIKGATIELVEALAALPEVAEIREEVHVPTPQIQFAANTTATTEAVSVLASEWGVTKIGAESVWATGNRGEGVVIGSLDTGIRPTHTAIKGNLRSTYNWFDAVNGRTTPYDDLGHGSHTIGTMVGQNGIGVAPNAQVIACKSFNADGGEESWLLSCAQFLTCPTTPSGTGKDCSKAPHVINNSWGGGQGDTFFAGAISAWRSAGIIPIFSNGNAGGKQGVAPSPIYCKTANSPADSANVIAVGATDVNDKLGYFSSKGPTVFNTIKPEISAPGLNTRSAWYTSDSAYASLQGTSMAAPHVSATVALMLSKNPSLTYDKIRAALISSVDTSTLKASGYTCGNTLDTQFPNNQYGYGRLNALKAVNAV